MNLWKDIPDKALDLLRELALTLGRAFEMPPEALRALSERFEELLGRADPVKAPRP